MENLWSIDRTTGEMTFVGMGMAGNGGFDGASCPFGVEMEKITLDTLVSFGDTITYTVNVNNASSAILSGITLLDEISFGGTVSTLPNNLFGGTVSSGIGSNTLRIDGISLPLGMSTFEFDVAMPSTNCGDMVISNQARLLNLPSAIGDTVLSDDPISSNIDDATSTTVTQPSFVAGSLSSLSSIVCSGDSLSFSYDNSQGDLTWQESNDQLSWSSFSSGTIQNDTTINLNQTTGITVFDTVYYRAMLTSVCDTAYSDTIVFEIHPMNYIGNLDTVSLICPGDVLSLPIDSVLADSVRWQYRPFGGTFSALAGESNDSISIVPPFPDTSEYRAIGFHQGGVCPEDTSNVGIVRYIITDTNDVVVSNDLSIGRIDSVQTLDYLSNDTAYTYPIDPSLFTILNSPVNGSVTVDTVNGSLTYTPNAGFFGVDSLEYQVCSMGCPNVCDEAYIVFRVLPPALACDETIYLSQNDGSGGRNLVALDLDASPFASNQLTNYSTAHNALGYNPKDNYLYAVSESDSRLLLIGTQNQVIDLGEIEGASSVGTFWAGAFDIDGNYWVNALDDSLHRINVNEVRIDTSIRLGNGTTTGFGDFAIPNDEMAAYGYAENNLVKVDLGTGNLTYIGSAVTNFATGAAMFDAKNNLYIYGSDMSSDLTMNTLWEADRATGMIDTVGMGFNATGGFDGASCPFGIGLEKVTLDTLVDFGDTIRYTISLINSSSVVQTGIELRDTITYGGSIENLPSSFLGGIIISGNGQGILEISNITLPVGQTDLVFDVVLPSTNCGDSIIGNQAWLTNLSTSLGGVVRSDNPNTTAIEDATGTRVTQPTLAGGDFNITSETYCTGDTAELQLQNSDGIVQWYSKHSTGSWEAQSSFTIVNDTVGSYLVTNNELLPDTTEYMAMVVNACDTTYSDTSMVIVHPQATAGIGQNLSICPHSSLEIDLSGTRADSIYWERRIDGGVYSTLTSQSDSLLVEVPPVPDALEYRAIVKFENGVCPFDTSNVIQVVFMDTSVVGTLNLGDLEICSGEETIISAVGFSGDLSWQTGMNGVWSQVGVGLDSISISEINESDSSVYYSVMTEVISSCDTLISDTVMVRVDPMPSGGNIQDGYSCVQATEVSLGDFAGDSIFWQWSNDRINWNQESVLLFCYSTDEF